TGLQGLCSLYYGAYLAVSLVVVVFCWICLVRPPFRGTLWSLGLGVAVAASIGWLVTRPYSANRASVGERHRDEVRAFSGTGLHDPTVNRRSAVYGSWLGDPHHGEQQLFPGTLPVLLGALSLLPPTGPVVVPAAVALAVSIGASLGLNGTIYSWLYK